MSEVEEQEAWVPFAEKINAGDAEGVTQFLDDLHAGEVARVVDRLDSDTRDALFTLMTPDGASELLIDLPGHQAADVLEHLDASTTAAIVSVMASDVQADLLGDLGASQSAAVLAEMAVEEADAARELMVYPHDTAGGLMQTELLRFVESSTVQDVLNDLRTNAAEYSDFDVQYAYVVDKKSRLRGVLRMRDLLLAHSDVQLGSLMIADPYAASDQLSLLELRSIFEERAYIALPVINDVGVLLGVVLRKSVSDATSDAVAEDFLKVAGVGKEELRSMPLRIRSGRRLSWLSVNILLNVLAASVIAFYQDTLAQVIALAVFLPIISDMSGCSGSQAVAVSIRELTLGLVRPSELARVLGKELSLGIINGLALGLLLAVVAMVWKGNPWLGAVVGGALMINTTVAVCLGGSIPLILKRFDLDPALASGPILTTVTDMCGFFLVLSLATTVLPHLI